MPDTAEKLMSLDEFLAWEREQPESHEYAGGNNKMMTGGSLDHSTIASNLWTAWVVIGSVEVPAGHFAVIQK
jgi:hypothetical protein